MRYVKALGIVLHILAGLLLLVVSGALINPHWAHVARLKSWWFARVLDLLGLDVQVCGAPLSQQPAQGRMVVANHVSWLDIPVIGSVTQTTFLSKAEVARWPVIGWLARGVGTLFIQRGSGDSGRVTRELKARMAAGHQVLVFPEGTTSEGQQVKRFYSKLFTACADGKTEVQPVLVHYSLPDQNVQTNPAAFIGDDEFASHIWNLLRYPRLRVTLLALPPRTIAESNVRESVATLQRDMDAALQQLRNADSVPVLDSLMEPIAPF